MVMAVTNQQQWVAAMSQALTKDEKAYFKALGARIAERRRELALTQVQMAAALDVTQQAYATYESGRYRVPVSMLPTLAQMLMMDMETLLGTTAKQRAKRGPAPKFQQHIERISRLPRAKQRFVIQLLEAALAQQGA
jgi:transcriptional regulator with XRE-family HTH domain